MPLISVEFIEGVFIPAQPPGMIRRLTDTAVPIEGANARPVVRFIAREARGGKEGISGEPLAATGLMCLVSGAPKR
jgi:hypothetical protein